jgi:hypothetical protein
MSIYFRPSKPISLAEIKKRCKGFNVRLLSSFSSYDPKDPDRELFHDDKNTLHFDVNQNGFVTDIYQYGLNDSSKILNELEAIFNIEIVNEHQNAYNDLGPAFWVKKQ